MRPEPNLWALVARPCLRRAAGTCGVFDLGESWRTDAGAASEVVPTSSGLGMEGMEGMEGSYGSSSGLGIKNDQTPYSLEGMNPMNKKIYPNRQSFYFYPWLIADSCRCAQDYFQSLMQRQVLVLYMILGLIAAPQRHLCYSIFETS